MDADGNLVAAPEDEEEEEALENEAGSQREHVFPGGEGHLCYACYDVSGVSA